LVSKYEVVNSVHLKEALLEHLFDEAFVHYGPDSLLDLNQLNLAIFPLVNAEELVCDLSSLLLNVEVHQYPLDATVPPLSVHYHLVSLSVILNDDFLRLVLTWAIYVATLIVFGIRDVWEWALEGAVPVEEDEVDQLGK